MELLELAEAAFNEQHDLGPHGLAAGDLPATQATSTRHAQLPSAVRPTMPSWAANSDDWND
jgi:hypothetical protein